MPTEWNETSDSLEFKLRGVVFSKVVKQRITESGVPRPRERVSYILPELTPIDISKGITSSKISVPIPASPALRMRMGFQGPTLHIIAYLHDYDAWKTYSSLYSSLKLSNWYSAWKWKVNIEDLIKVSDSTDVGTVDDDTYDVFDANPSSHGYGSPHVNDLDNIINPHLSTTSYSALLDVKPGTYWYVRKREITRQSGWCDKFRLELDLERCWQWSTSGRQRPAYDVDVMACFKNGETGYQSITKEYSSDT